MTEGIEDILRAAAGPATDTAPPTNGLAGHLQQSENPVVQLLALYLLAQQQNAASGPAEEPEGSDVLQREVDVARAEIRLLQRRIGDVAAALGRCEVCWGEESGCPLCGGRGSSGYFWPDRHAYDRMVAPAAARMQVTGHDTARAAERHNRSEERAATGRVPPDVERHEAPDDWPPT